MPTPLEDDDLNDILAGLPATPATELVSAPDDPPPTPAATPASTLSQPDDEDSPTAFMEAAGIQQEKTVSYRRRPWMDEHTFILVKSIEELRAIVNEAINVTHKCALDLETEGLDTRVYKKKVFDLKDHIEEYWADYRETGEVPETVHKIVGYCLCPDGKTGYYVPIRHKSEDASNIDAGEAAKEIARLCHAAQPVLTEKGRLEDPLGSREIAEPGKVKLFFWHAKFDQEMLYPVVGLDYWHPDSFECGNLLYFCRKTSDKQLSLKDKAPQELMVKKVVDVKDPTTGKIKRTVQHHPYEMIELKELFVTSTGKKREIDFASLHPEEAYEYGASDSICTYLLCEKQENVDILLHAAEEKNEFEKRKKLAIQSMYRLEKQVGQVLRVMERNRIMVDLDYVRALFEEATKEAAGYEDEIKNIAISKGWHALDLRSSKQLSDFLFTDRGLDITPKPAQNEASGQYKTDADTLEELVENNPELQNGVLLKLVKFRQIDKVVGTYLTNMVNFCDANHEIRYQFKQTGAATARFSAPAGDTDHGYSGVPIHGIPATYDDKKPKVATALRKAFKARSGFTMVKVDFAGEELRIATNLSKEPVWIEEFTNGSGDLHSITARAFFNKAEVSKQERQMGKTANFALLYGGGAASIVRATGCSQVEAQRRKANFDKALPTFAKWVRDQKARCHKEKGVWTAFHRWIAVPEIDDPEKARVAGAERASINYPVQGTGADIMKIALVLLHKEFFKRGWLQADKVRMLLTVHDEIVFEVQHEILQEAMEVIVRLMEEPGRMVRWTVPLIAEALIDETWDAKYDWDSIIKGKALKEGQKLKDNQIVVDGRVYTKVPKWLDGYIIPNWQMDGAVPEVKAAEPVAEASTTPATSSEVPVPQAAPPTVEAKAPVPVASTTKVVTPVANFKVPTSNGQSNGHSNGIKEEDIAVFPIADAMVTQNTLTQVIAACHMCADPKGKILHLVGKPSNETLIDPSLGIRIDPVKFQYKLDDHNL